MSPRRKTTPMKYKGFYCDEKLYKEMQNCAITLNESDSEYIRKAIEIRNYSCGDNGSTRKEFYEKSDLPTPVLNIPKEIVKEKSKKIETEKPKEEFKSFFKNK